MVEWNGIEDDSSRIRGSHFVVMAEILKDLPCNSFQCESLPGTQAVPYHVGIPKDLSESRCLDIYFHSSIITRSGIRRRCGTGARFLLRLHLDAARNRAREPRIRGRRPKCPKVVGKMRVPLHLLE